MAQSIKDMAAQVWAKFYHANRNDPTKESKRLLDLVELVCSIADCPSPKKEGIDERAEILDKVYYEIDCAIAECADNRDKTEKTKEYAQTYGWACRLAALENLNQHLRAKFGG